MTGKTIRKTWLGQTLAGDGLGVCVAGLIGGLAGMTYGEVTGAVMINKQQPRHHDLGGGFCCLHGVFRQSMRFWLPFRCQ